MTLKIKKEKYMSQTWFIKLPSIETKLQITEASHKVAVNSFKIMAILNFYFGPRKNRSMHKKAKVSVKDFLRKFEEIAEICSYLLKKCLTEKFIFLISDSCQGNFFSKMKLGLVRK